MRRGVLVVREPGGLPEGSPKGGVGSTPNPAVLLEVRMSNQRDADLKWMEEIDREIAPLHRWWLEGFVVPKASHETEE